MITQNNDLKQLEHEVARLRSAVEELTVLNELAMAASSSLEVERMLDIIVEKSIKAVRAEQGAIQLITLQEKNPLQTLIRQADQRSRLLTYKVGIHLTGWVLKYRAPLIVENLATDERFSPNDQETKEIRSILSVPIQFKGQMIGILTVTNKKTLEPFTKGDLRLLSIIAAQSGQLIQNLQLQKQLIEKQRLAHELALARKMQQDLIPKIDPGSAFLEISSYFGPAEEVGGDYYDYFSLRDGEIGIVLADVAGHGASAAMIMTMIKGILHSLVYKFVSVDQVLQELNQILNKILPPEIFITMLIMVINPLKKTLTLSNAGHNPALFFDSSSKSAGTLEITGCALNGLKNPAYEIRRIELGQDDSVVLYTDGFTEAENSNHEMFGQERLLREFRTCAADSAGGIIQHLMTKLKLHLHDESPRDDIALIAVKVK
ncbi:MAG: SpoIIE family protein phosphatase [Calditrichia bacterium]